MNVEHSRIKVIIKLAVTLQQLYTELHDHLGELKRKIC